MTASLSVVLGADPLLGPLTGIGNYTKQLALGLNNHAEITQLRLFAHTNFIDKHNILYGSGNADNDASYLKSRFAQLKEVLAQQQLAVKVYEKIVPTVAKYQLKRFSKDSLYHSPNFILPPFDGPQISTFHDLSVLTMPHCHPLSRVKLMEKAMQNAVESGAHIITDAEYVKQEVIKYYGLNDDRVTAIHLAAEDAYKPYSEVDCVNTLSKYKVSYKKYFLFVSTIEPRKNILNLLAAYKKYTQLNPSPLPLLLVGGRGWNSEREHKEMQSLVSQGYVRYLGYVSNEEKFHLYAAARALLFPSTYEGFGLPLLEAMQSGTAVLTSVNSTMSEITGNTGILVEHRDVDGITAGIQELHSGNTLHLLQNKGLVRAREFSWGRVVRNTVEVYKRTLTT